MFFRDLGLGFDYEPDGFVSRSKEIWYRPDFYLPDLGYFCEVKPDLNQSVSARGKAEFLVRTTLKPTVIVFGVPDAKTSAASPDPRFSSPMISVHIVTAEDSSQREQRRRSLLNKTHAVVADNATFVYRNDIQKVGIGTWVGGQIGEPSPVQGWSEKVDLFHPSIASAAHTARSFQFWNPVEAPGITITARDDTDGMDADRSDDLETNSLLEELIDIWPKIRADVKALDRRAEALLQDVDPVDITGDEVVLAASYSFTRDCVNETECHSIVEEVISRRLGRVVRAHCILKSDASRMGVAS